jgi:DNA-binding transcriptional LysR family regulator
MRWKESLDRFAPFELLLAIADAGNIGRAAKALGMSNAATSRFLAALEECLGAQLVRRNTRCLYLTEVYRQLNLPPTAH